MMTASLSEQLSSLGLYFTASTIDDLVASATKNRWGPVEILSHVAKEEAKERARRSLERRLTRSRLGRFTPMADFDWAWPARIDKEAVEEALRLDFLTSGRNLVLVA